MDYLTIGELQRSFDTKPIDEQIKIAGELGEWCVRAIETNGLHRHVYCIHPMELHITKAIVYGIPLETFIAQYVGVNAKTSPKTIRRRWRRIKAIIDTVDNERKDSQ